MKTFNLLFIVALLSGFTQQAVTALDTWEIYDARYQVALHGRVEKQSTTDQVRHPYVSPEIWQLVEPYLMTEKHPLKQKLDKLFSESRVISSRQTMVAAGFVDKKPEPVTKIIVTRHKRMKGYIFKFYTDDYLDYHHGEPEYYTYVRRVRGARLIKKEIEKLGWKDTFKVPKKWIYALPSDPGPLSPKHFRRNFILVEKEMKLLPQEMMKRKWVDGTMNMTHLQKIHYLTTRLGLRGCCKMDNIPICTDGKIAFVDTQSNLRWPIAYERLTSVLRGHLRFYWKNLTRDKSGSFVPKIIASKDQIPEFQTFRLMDPIF